MVLGANFLNVDLASIQGSFADFLEIMFHTLSESDLERFVCYCWRVWKLRNDVLKERKLVGLIRLLNGPWNFWSSSKFIMLVQSQQGCHIVTSFFVFVIEL